MVSPSCGCLQLDPLLYITLSMLFLLDICQLICLHFICLVLVYKLFLLLEGGVTVCMLHCVCVCVCIYIFHAKDLSVCLCIHIFFMQEINSVHVHTYVCVFAFVYVCVYVHIYFSC